MLSKAKYGSQTWSVQNTIQYNTTHWFTRVGNGTSLEAAQMQWHWFICIL